MQTNSFAWAEKPSCLFMSLCLQGCDLYVMDACAMVTIDDCRDCRIFIGPTESRWVQSRQAAAFSL